MTDIWERNQSNGTATSWAEALDHDPSIEHHNTPLWREAAWPLEWLNLRFRPEYYARNLPRGNGEPVLLIPGFMAGDSVMLEMHHWLNRLGYEAHSSHIVWNTDCPDSTAQALIERVRKIHHDSGHKVRLLGHSLGGMLSKYIAQEVPEMVDRVITMGSPFRSLVKAHPSVVGIWDKLKLHQSGLIGRNLKPSCATGHCTCGFVRSVLLPKPTGMQQFAVYSKTDGVADWESCIEEDDSLNTEVKSTHIGMIFNVEVYRIVAQRLTQNEAID